jgi:hypothetical protein
MQDGESGDDQPRGRAGWVSPVASWLALNWVLLLGGAIAGFFLGSLALGPAQYTAQALVATSPRRTQAQLDSSITTDTTSKASVSISPERRQALADLVSTGAVETAAIARLQQTLPGQHFQPGDLLNRVHGSLLSRSDVIAIQVDADTQADAAAIANAWAASYVEFINQLYVKDAGPSLDTLIAQRDRAAAERDAAQQALNANLQQSKLEELVDGIQQRQQELDLLQATPVNFEVPSTDYRAVQVQTLNDLSQTLRRIEVAEQSARVLLQGMPADPSASSGDETALTLLKAQLVSLSESTNSTVRLEIPSFNGDGSVTTRSQLETLVADLEQTRGQLSSELVDQREIYEAQVAERTSQIDDELRQMRADLERARAERNSLTARRDLAQSAYDALAKTVQEQTITNADAGREVEIATLARDVNPLVQLGVVPRAAGVVLGMWCAVLIALLLRGLRRRWWESPSLGPASGIG